MAKNAVKVRDLKRRKLVDRYEAKRKELKAKGDWEGLDKLPRNSSPVRLHNRCNLSGRPKGYMRKFGISRLESKPDPSNRVQKPAIRRNFNNVLGILSQILC